MKCSTPKFYLDGSLGSVVMVGGRDMFTEDAEDIPNVTEAAVDAAVEACRGGGRRGAAGAEQVRSGTPSALGRRSPCGGGLPHGFTIKKLVLSISSACLRPRTPYGSFWPIITWRDLGA